jgi:hypothetical protein
MKLTLLEIVQDILSSMDSDEVNSISDTIESLQVAKIVRDSYVEIIDRLEAPESFSLFELEPVGVTAPTMMTLPSDVASVLWIKYDDRDSLTETIPEYKPVWAMTLPDFLEEMYNLDSTNAAFDSYNYTLNGDTIEIFCYTDLTPTRYTVLEDNTILFNSYDVGMETNLQKSKVLAYGKVIPSFTFDDSFTPRLDANQFGLLLNEAKRQAFVELKQAQNIVAEQRAKRGWIRSQRNLKNVPTHTQYSTYPDYGRK